MSIQPGTRLGPYEVLSSLGAGGMGEVYRARDTKLNRDVAIKVLPDLFAADPERLARFTREAQVLASLNHPNIAHVYGVEAAALVMELVEGEDLSVHIARGPIHLAEALPIAKQIADALEAAHEAGIVHRDLKPANVKVRPDGTVKVLDFGLAKAADPAVSSVSAMQSPTLTAAAFAQGFGGPGTQMGVILGTAAYMAPEQARGKAVDKRADIWAFGVVFYEMLTGRRAFKGDEISDVLAAVLRQDIDWAALPAGTPPGLRRLLARCLDRDAKRRLRDIGDARVAIDDLISGAGAETPAPRVSSRAMAWPALALTSLATALVVAAGVWLWPRPVESVPPLVQAMIPSPLDFAIGARVESVVAVSATHVAFIAGPNDQLFLRALAAAEATPLAGATGASWPFFSPDGQWLAFFSAKDRKLKKVPAAGGPISNICDVDQPHGADWGPAGIVFSDRVKGIFTIATDGGAPQLLVRPDRASVLTSPSWLPGGRAILYADVGRFGSNEFDFNIARVLALSLDAGAKPAAVVEGYAARFVPPHGLVFMRENALLGMRFDPRTHTTSGGAETLVTDVASNGYAVASTGALVFQRNASTPRITYVWVDRQNHAEPTGIQPQSFTYPRISPDGTRIVLASRSADRDLWIWDLRQKNLTRLTTDRGVDAYPVWTPDNRRVIYAGSVKSGDENLMVRAADGTGGAEPLLVSDRHQTPYSISPDGEWVVFRDEVPGHQTDLGILRMSTREAKPLLADPFAERNGEISPDGRLIAYQSNETGTMEIYVRPFPNVNAGKKQVSSGGGIRPCWSRDGRRLFYLTNDLPPMSMNGADLRSPGALDFAPPSVLFDASSYTPINFYGRTYDVAADGRFLMPRSMTSTGAADLPGVVLILNWAQHLSTNR